MELVEKGLKGKEVKFSVFFNCSESEGGDATSILIENNGGECCLVCFPSLEVSFKESLLREESCGEEKFGNRRF